MSAGWAEVVGLAAGTPKTGDAPDVKLRQRTDAARIIQITFAAGQSMAGHLQHAGYEMHVFNRTKAKADTLLQNGAHWHDTPGEVAANSDVVITMVGYPADVEDVYLGANGIIENAQAGSYLIDMTTSEPSLAIRISEAATAKGIEVTLEGVSGVARVEVLGDHAALLSVFSNLISNAVKYTPTGGNVRAGLSADGCCARVSVSDDGIGMSPEECARCFDEFFRARNRYTSGIPGTGLGLTLCRRLVEIAGWTPVIATNLNK